MEVAKLKRKMLWLAGTLMVGALGSGLWEAVLKPGLFWVVALALDVATLGMHSLRDNLYADIAKGSYERASVMNMAVVLGTVSGILIGVVFAQIVKKNRPVASPSKKRKLKWLLQAMLAAYAIMLTVQCFRITYIVRAANHIAQMERIVKPYLSNEQLVLIDSRAASMRTRAEYVDITNQLNVIAKHNGIIPPSFDVY